MEAPHTAQSPDTLFAKAQSTRSSEGWPKLRESFSSGRHASHMHEAHSCVVGVAPYRFSLVSSIEIETHSSTSNSHSGRLDPAALVCAQQSLNAVAASPMQLVGIERLPPVLPVPPTPPPTLPDEIVAKTREKYVDAYERLVGKKFPWK